MEARLLIYLAALYISIFSVPFFLTLLRPLLALMAVPDLQDAINHLEKKDLDAAIAALERKIDELPAHLTAHVLLARAYETKHQWTRALKTWENVHFLMPNSPVGKEGKARVLRQLDRDEEAEEVAPSGSAAPSAPASSESAQLTPEDEPKPKEDEAESEADEETPTTATEAVSELEQLRRQAEEEARRGGARPELTEDAASPPPDASASEETPEARVGQLEDEEEDLDRLIDELESAQIEPDPDVDEVPTPDLENDIDDLVSETLARIHEGQNEYRKAAQIYVKLASQEPDRAREYLEKAAEMREQAEAAAQQSK